MLPISEQDITTQLKELGVYVTRNRVVVLKILTECGGAVSVPQIRRLSQVKLDRVSVYRTLQFFLEKGLLFVVPNSKGVPHYAVAESRSADNQRGAAFFICRKCGASEFGKKPVDIDQSGNDNILANVKASYVVFEGDCKKCECGEGYH